MSYNFPALLTAQRATPRARNNIARATARGMTARERAREMTVLGTDYSAIWAMQETMCTGQCVKAVRDGVRRSLKDSLEREKGQCKEQLSSPALCLVVSGSVVSGTVHRFWHHRFWR